MSYTDREMLIATQISYLNIPEGQTVEEYIDRMERTYGSDANQDTLSEQIKSQMNTINNLRQMAGNDESYKKWKVVRARNDESKSGMYAAVIDTGDGNAIVGFRGSESYDKEQTLLDWGLSDFGLLNNTLTPQQAAAEKFIKSVYDEFGDQYNSFSITGHSLGGNLAEHATLSAPDEMYRKIDRCISFDGPGYSDEYLAAHAMNVMKHSGKIDHYQWSIIGTLLNPVPGTNYRTIDADTPTAEEAGDVPPLLFRHDTKNVNFNDDGSTKDGERDPLAANGFVISKYIEDTPGMQVSELVIGGLFLALIAYGDKIMDAISKNVASIAEKMRAWFSNTFGSSIRGDYSVNTDALLASAEAYMDAMRQMQRIAEEAESIRKDLPYFSKAAAIYKLKLRYTANNISKDASYAKKFGDVLSKNAQVYINGDHMAAENF